MIAVYAIKCIENNKSYIGVSNNINKNGITYLGSIEASIKTNIPRTTLLRYAKNNTNGWSCYRLTNWS